MTPKIINGICQHMDTDSAKNILWVSSSPDDLPIDLPCTHCVPDKASLDALDNSRFDYAVLSGLHKQLSRQSAEALIARMRDVNAQKVFWVIDDDACWNNSDALAFGFHQLQQDEGHTLYGFDIDNYKSTPDWLNAKNWANPDRWNKERW